MRRRSQVGSALLLAIAVVASMAFVAWEYRRDSDACRLLYTGSVKKRDILDNARNAFAALNDAEVREQDYVLTGETVYAEAYTDAIRTWEDEDAALELVVRNDPAALYVQYLSKAGTRTVNELALVVSLYENNGRDAALERIRKSSGIVYLDQARDSIAMIQKVDGGSFDGSSQVILRAVSSLRRLTAEATGLFFLAVTGTLLLIFEVCGKH